MVLSVHTLVGGALGATLGASPITSFVVGFASHYLLDAIPHADYPKQSLQKNKGDRTKDFITTDGRFAHDIVVNGIDLILGFLVLVSLTYKSSLIWSVIAGAIGACTPDGLQFLHLMFPKIKILDIFPRIHAFFHTPLNIEEHMEKYPVVSVALQGGILAASLISILRIIPVPF